MTGRGAKDSAFREARLGLQLSLAETASFMGQLEQQDPLIYSALDRTNINHLETNRTDWRTAGTRGMRALITVLFGSLEAFKAATGEDAYLSPASNQPRATDAQIAAALAEKQQQRELDMRDVAGLTEALAEQQPKAYRAIAKSTVHRIVSGSGRLSERPAGVTRAMITGLFGSVEQFVRETGLDPYLSEAGLTHHMAPVPVWPVGVALDPADLVLNPQHWMTPALPARYALAVRGRELEGLVPAGELLWVQPTDRATRGALHVIYRRGAVEVAWALNADTFGELSGRYFQLTDRDAVLGTVLNEGVQAPLGALPLGRAG